MTTASYEIEIKSLLGEKEKAEALKSRLFEKDPGTKLTGTNTQLNHYFTTDGDKEQLIENLTDILLPEELEVFAALLRGATDFSLRTRQTNDQLILVLKISADGGTSSNGVGRREFEATIPALTLQELDEIILDAGFSYQAKWSRDREEYAHRGITVTIDKNAGYGYLAEFEIVEQDQAKIADRKQELLTLMRDLEIEELDQERLGRMFAYYNENWPEYYGTEKVFTIE